MDFILYFWINQINTNHIDKDRDQNTIRMDGFRIDQLEMHSAESNLLFPAIEYNRQFVTAQ